MTDVDAVLAAKREELEAEIATLTAPSADLGGIGFGKRVGEGTALAVERLSQVAAHGRLVALLAEVRRAQAKRDDDSYGTCDDCGDPVAPARLEALPWATRCIGCQGRASTR
jgi:DnaK suppressor protein